MSQNTMENTTNALVTDLPDIALLSTKHGEPSNVEEALASDLWKKSMQSELDQLKKLRTYKLVNLPKGLDAIKPKWVWKTKLNGDRNFVKAKSCLVARGFTQQPEIDYNKTYAPVVRLDTLRILMALVVAYGFKFHTVDIVGAYLNANLHEEIYMSQPPGFEDGTLRVMRLLKTIYGLKQAGYEWNKILDEHFKKIRFTRLISNQCIYICGNGDLCTIVAVRMDDMSIFAFTDGHIAIVKQEIKSKFEITNLEETHHIVGLTIN